MPQNQSLIFPKLQKFFILTAILLAPSNLFLKLLPNSGYVHGLQIDYLIPKLFLTDLFMLCSIFLEVVSNWKIIKHRFFETCTQWKKIPKFKFQIPNKSQNKKLKIKKNVVSNQKSQSSILRPQSSRLLPIAFLLPFSFFLFPFSFLTRQLFTPFPVIALWTTVRLGLFIAFFFLVKHSKLISRTLIVNIFLFSVLIQAIWGTSQFFFQHSLTPYWLTGETQLQGQPYLARVDFSWLDTLIGTNFGIRILPYGLTQHPNVLAGFLAMGIVVWFIEYLPHLPRYRLAFSPQGERPFFRLTPHNLPFPIAYSLLPIPFAFSLFLTQSLSAWIAVALFILSTIFFKYLHNNLTTQQLNNFFHIITYSLLPIAFLLLPFTLSLLPSSFPGIDKLSITRRIALNQDAWGMFLQHPLLGVGVNQFTAFVEDISRSKEVVNFVQPAHHVGLLFLAENGLVGMALLLVFLFIIQKKITTHNLQLTTYNLSLPFAFFLLPILTLDHYLYTLNQGWWMIWIITMFVTKTNQENQDGTEVSLEMNSPQLKQSIQKARKEFKEGKSISLENFLQKESQKNPNKLKN